MVKSIEEIMGYLQEANTSNNDTGIPEVENENKNSNFVQTSQVEDSDIQTSQVEDSDIQTSQIEDSDIQDVLNSLGKLLSKKLSNSALLDPETIKSLNNKVEDLQGIVKDLSEVILLLSSRDAERDKQVVFIANRVINLEKVIDSLTKAMGETAVYIQNFTEELINKPKENLQLIYDNVESLSEQVKNMKSGFKDMGEKIEKTEEKIREKTKEIEELDAKINNIQQQTAGMQSYYNNELSQAKSMLGSLKDDIKNILTEVEALKGEVEALKGIESSISEKNRR